LDALRACAASALLQRKDLPAALAATPGCRACTCACIASDAASSTVNARLEISVRENLRILENALLNDLQKLDPRHGLRMSASGAGCFSFLNGQQGAGLRCFPRSAERLNCVADRSVFSSKTAKEFHRLSHAKIGHCSPVYNLPRRVSRHGFSQKSENSSAPHLPPAQRKKRRVRHNKLKTQHHQQKNDNTHFAPKSAKGVPAQCAIKSKAKLPVDANAAKLRLPM